MTERIAIDVDLRSITAVSTERGILCKQLRVTPDAFQKAYLPCLQRWSDILLLLEIAGPVMHGGTGRDACPPGKRRWMIYNAAWVSEMCVRWGNVRVATSTSWTMGYKESERHAIAGVLPMKSDKSGKAIYAENHDVREVRAMLHMHGVAPQRWSTLYDYLEAL